MEHTTEEIPPIFVLLGLAVYFWPLIVSTLYTLLRWGAIQGKVSFWFLASFAGYVLMYGMPYLGIHLLDHFIGWQNIVDDMAKPSHKWFVEHYWSLMAAGGLAVGLLPVISTHWIFRRINRA